MKKILTSALMAIALFAIALHSNLGNAQTKKSKKMEKKILFVVSSHDKKGNTGESTGYYLGEVTHAWEVLKDDYTIDFVSPKGGTPPVDGFDLGDPINKQFWDDAVYHDKINNSMKPSLLQRHFKTFTSSR